MSRFAFRLALAGCLIVAAGAGSAAEPATAPLDEATLMPLEATVEVDGNGMLTHFELTSDAPKEIRAGMGTLVGPWRFEPGRDDAGNPVATKAGMRLVLRAEPDGERFRVTVDNVTFHRPHGEKVVTPTATVSYAKLTPPRWPRKVLADERAVVLVALRLAPDGKVAEAVVVQSALYDPKDTSAGSSHALQKFEQSTLATARHWDFQVEATGTPTLDDLTLVVPVRYGFRDEFASELGQWRRLARTARISIPWLQPGSGVDVGVADVGGNTPASVEQPVKLLTRVAGAKL